MRKLLNKPWVVALLAFAAVALIAQSLLDRPKSRPRRVAPEAAEVAAESLEDLSSAPGEVARSLPEALRSFSLPEHLPDPFAPRRLRLAAAPDAVREAAPDHTETVRLSAIWEQDGSTYLLLNGRICRPGDSVGRLTIASVEREGVWLAHWKGRDFVRLGQDFTLVTPAALSAKPKIATHEG